jgi:hypothetical protein
MEGYRSRPDLMTALFAAPQDFVHEAQRPYWSSPALLDRCGGNLGYRSCLPAGLFLIVSGPVNSTGPPCGRRQRWPLIQMKGR